MDSRLTEVYLNKLECVIDFPDWLLSPRKIEEYRTMPGLGIVEIAGRDSVAAAVKSVEEESFTDLLPTYVYTGTEHGAWTTVERAVGRLSRRLPETHVHGLLVLGSPRFWQALNGRFVGELVSRYGFYSPCIGCHLYLHSVRVLLSMVLGNVPVISGERERHDGAIKINQISEALDLYQDMARNFGVRLVFPLRYISTGDRIKKILGFDWEEGKEQLGCVLSKNYLELRRSIEGTVGQIERYVAEFARPCTQRIIESYAAGNIPNHLEIAGDVLRG